MSSSTETQSYDPLTVNVTFACKWFIFDREQFQREGHFVPSTCSGFEVHALNLHAPDGTQVLRVMASTRAEAVRTMQEGIQSLVWTQHAAQAQQAYTYQEFQALVEERGQLSQFLLTEYVREAQTGTGLDFSRGPVAVTLTILRRERKRWPVRLRNWWFRRSQPTPTLTSDTNDWLPKDRC